MKYTVVLLSLFLHSFASSQVLRHADSLYAKYYNENIKAKGIKFHIWSQYGRFSELEKFDPYRTTKIESLQIVSIIKTNKGFESALFGDSGESVINNFDTCFAYEFLQKYRDSIPQISPYFKLRRKATEANLSKEQPSGYFEIIFIKLGRAEYFFSLDNLVFDTYGNYIKNEYWYSKVRVLIDYFKGLKYPR